MPLWTSTLIAGGSLYAGVRVLQTKRQKRLVERLSGIEIVPKNERKSTSTRLLDALMPLNEDQNISVTQHAIRRANINLGIAGIAIVLTGAGVLIPNLTIVGTLFVTVAAIEIYRDAFSAIINDRRLRHPIIDALALTTALSAGYYFASAIAAGLYFLGIRTLRAAEGHTSQTIAEIFTQQERKVWLILDDQLVEVSLSSLQAGDHVAVEAGEIIPVDGRVVDGIALVDQNILTGEAQPVTKSTDDRVFASTMVQTGNLVIYVEQSGDDTVAMEVARLLQNHNLQQQQVTQQAELIADQAAVPTLGIAAGAWMLIGPFSAAAVLNANFSEILRIAMPLSLLNHVNLALQQGILFKDGRGLESLQGIDTIIFDKTGTLTVNQPELTNIYTLPDVAQQDVLWFAALAEQHQSHPIAKAVMSAAAALQLEFPHLDDSAYEVGFGLHVHWDDRDILVGSERLF